MKYIPLKAYYYKNNTEYEQEYLKRFNAPTTQHFDIEINQYNHTKSYPAFLCYSEDILQLTQQIYQAYTKLIRFEQTVPAIMIRQFALLSILDEIKSTNDIEGVRSTKKEIREIMDNQSEVLKDARLQSVVDKYIKILDNQKFSFKTCQDIRNFYDSFALNEVVSQNPNHAPDGKVFRKDPVVITSGTDKTLHQGIWPEAKLITAMDKALTILNKEDMPLLVRLAVFHYLFGYIHPFYDGNGRTDRFITSYYLAKEFGHIIALRISITIKKKKNEYYEVFRNTDSEINRGDLTNFVIYFLKLLLETFDNAFPQLIRKREQLIKYRDKLNKMQLGDETSKQIYFTLFHATLFYGEGLTIKQLMEATHKARVTIQKRLDEMPKEHLTVFKETKPYRYKLNSMLFRSE